MESITLVADAIHRPDEPRHFMEFMFPDARWLARIADIVVADSTRVLKLAEVGFHIYDPVIYFPLSDTAMAHLEATEKSTHCPLKGDTHYYDFVAGDERRPEIAWRYAKPLPFAEKLRDYIAFDRRQVTLSQA